MKPGPAITICLAALAPAAANAAIVPVGTGVSEVVALGQFAWAYNLHWQKNQRVFSELAPEFGLVANADRSLANTFTIHGFAGYVSGTCTAPAGWVCTAQHLGPTPGTETTNDLIADVNLIWAYTTGPAIVGKGGTIDLGQFGAQSIYGNTTAVSYSWNTAREFRLATAAASFNMGITQGPSAGQRALPEPTSLGLAGLGLLMLRLWRRPEPR